MTFALSSCGTTAGKKITPLSRHGSTAIGSRWTIATWSWSRTMTCGVTALYFWSIVTASKLTPTRHLLSKHRADMSEPQVRFDARQQPRVKLFLKGADRHLSSGD